ncbi:gene transfer agent family protein [Sphingomonas sanguinis]|uniref:gene transfer agent family protein n=1 Tax=Sphingomonas sp. LC-1 TaxID=3110957 RepID=UPI0021BA6DC3|nr:gene transfer agent family protein [Sphingomonas sp. LC-1]MCT8002386.1 gene transfer agent family protein [Sphingomonas sp. LC-1]
MTAPFAQTSPAVAQICAYYNEIRSRPRRVTWIEVPFADGIYRFTLRLPQIEELERTLGYIGRDGARIPMGIGAIFARLAKGRAFLSNGEPDWSSLGEAEALASEIAIRDSIEVIRLALIGGNRAIVNGIESGVPPQRALQLIDAYIVGQPVEDAWHYAFAIVGALIFGVEPPSEPIKDEG